jgi:hypothetical protein
MALTELNPPDSDLHNFQRHKLFVTLQQQHQPTEFTLKATLE